ncbi:hypothetical protein FDZ74_08420, partial [bacterium]
MTGLFAALAAVYFMVLAIQQASWQLYVLTGVFAIAWIFSVFAGVRSMFENDITRIMVMSGVFQFAVLCFAVLVSGMAIPGAAIILLYSLIVSSSALSGGKTELGVSLGLFIGSAAAIAGTISPVHQINAPQLFTVLPTILGILIMVYLALVMMQFVVATLRIKLISSTLAVVLIPLILLAFINSRFTQNALQSQINQSLKLAAQQTADKVDEFLRKTRDTVSYQAGLPTIYNYLSMNPEERNLSLVKDQLDLTIDSLQFEHSDYLTSIAIINMFGENIYDTSPFLVGTNEKALDYFNITTSTEKPYASPVLFSEDTGAGYIYFSAPIRSPQQQLIGVLRVRFDALVFQSIVDEDAGSIGSRSHPILIDENQLRLADSLTPSQLYRTISSLPYESILSLRDEDRLPYKPNSELTTNLGDLSNAINRVQMNSFFSLEIHPDSSEDHVEAGAIAMLQSQPWTVLFVQEKAGLVEVINEQNRVSTLV